MLCAEFNAHEKMQMVTCGKGHVAFWTLENGVLNKKLGLFEVRTRTLYRLIMLVQLGLACTVCQLIAATNGLCLCVNVWAVARGVCVCAETREAQICYVPDVC